MVIIELKIKSVFGHKNSNKGLLKITIGDFFSMRPPPLSKA